MSNKDYVMCKRFGIIFRFSTLLASFKLKLYIWFFIKSHKMKYVYCTLIAVSVFFTSCKDDQSTAKGDSRQVVPFTQQASTGIQNQIPTGATSQSHNLFRENNATTASAGAISVNPAHGQPNHRCDIPVGAPLNSAASAPATTATAAPIQQTVVSSAPRQVTAKGMNPPHGEKNHRCDIPVGAPLNTKVATENPDAPQDQNGTTPLPALLSTDKE